MLVQKISDMDRGSNLAVTMSDPETSGQFVTRDEFSRHEARLDSRLDEILQLMGRPKARIQDGATGLDKESEIAALKAEIGKLKQEKEMQRNVFEGEIANLKAEIGKHKQEKERERNLLLSQSLEHEKAKEDMDALRKEMIMTTELESAKKQQKTLQQEKEELIAEIASLKTRLQQEKSVDKIAEIRAQLEETQQKMNHLEEKLKKAASEERNVREKHEEKMTALDNHLKSLLTNQVHQKLMEERTDIHSSSCSVFDEEILKKIRHAFVQHINPLNVLHFFHKYNTRILTQHDIEKVTAVTKSNGKFVGAAELLSCLVRYKDWFPCLLQVLREPLVKQEHVATRMEEILEQDPVVEVGANNLMDEENEDAHHGTETQEISRLHRHMEVLEIALTTCRNEIRQANTDKNEVRDKLDKLETHIQKVETSHDQNKERLTSLEKLTQQTQSNMTKQITDLQKTFKDNIRKTKLELDTKIDSIDKKFQKTQEQRDENRRREIEDRVAVIEAKRQVELDHYTKELEETKSLLDDVVKKVEDISTQLDKHDSDKEMELGEERMPELTRDMEEEISRALRQGNPNDVLSEGFGMQITRRDMATLGVLNWLNEEIINFYMNMLMARGELKGKSKVHAFNASFLQKIMSGGHRAVKSWTKEKDIFSMHFILIPVHLDMHWCLCVVDIKAKRITYYDSRGASNKACLQAVLEYVNYESIVKKAIPIKKDKWHLIFEDDPYQINVSDCGVFMCKYAEYITRGRDITFTHEDMPYFRRLMVYEILHKKLLQ